MRVMFELDVSDDERRRIAEETACAASEWRATALGVRQYVADRFASALGPKISVRLLSTSRRKKS